LLRVAFGALLLLISVYVTGDQNSRLLNVAIIAVPYPLAEMLTANYFGQLSDRIGRKKVIVFGSLLAAGIVGLYALSNDTWYLATLHGIHGMAAAATVAPAIAMIADHSVKSDRGRQMGWFDYSTLLGYIMGAVMGGILVDNVDPMFGFLLVSAMLASSAVLLIILVRNEPSVGRSEMRGFAQLKSVFTNNEVRLMFPIWLVVATLLGLALTYLPIIFMSQHIHGITIGIMFAGAGVVLGLLQPFWGKMSDRFGRIPVMCYGVFSMLGVVLMVLLIPDAIYSQDVSGIHFHLLGGIPLVIMGLGVGAFVPAALALMADSSDTNAYGATMGLYSFALGFGAFIAESIGLAIILVSGHDAAPGWLLYFAAALVALAVIMVVVFFLARKIFSKISRV
jgi:MFS family permease